MTAIRIHRKLESDTLHIPELRPLIGREVDIIVTAEPIRSTITPGTGDWDAVDRALKEIQDYDYDAQRLQDECDIRDAENRFR